MPSTPIFVGEGDQRRDRLVLDAQRGEQALVAGLAEAAVDELDRRSPGVGLADELRADRPGDPLVAGLLGVDRAVLGVGHREQGERRERRPGQVLGDVAVHLPVRDEPEHLVARDGVAGRLRGGAIAGRGTRAEHGGRRTGRRGGGCRAEHEDQGDGDDDGDGTEADDGPSGHALSVGRRGNRVKCALPSRETRTRRRAIWSAPTGRRRVGTSWSTGAFASEENTDDHGPRS